MLFDIAVNAPKADERMNAPDESEHALEKQRLQQQL